jgi:hypothetical protein
MGTFSLKGLFERAVFGTEQKCSVEWGNKMNWAVLRYSKTINKLGPGN